MHPTSCEFRSVRVAERKGHPLSLDPSEVSAAMDRIRNHVHHWLDQLEALADAAIPIEQSTEEERAALQAAIESHQREWEAQVEALDHDRRLLAEAWERLEHEQITALSMPRTADAPVRSNRPQSAAPASSKPSELDNVVDQAILRQFETLRKDVRRTAESRGHSSP